MPSEPAFCKIFGVKSGNEFFIPVKKPARKASPQPVGSTIRLGVFVGIFIILPLKQISVPFLPSVITARRAKLNIFVCEKPVCFLNNSSSYSFSIRPAEFFKISTSSEDLKSGIACPGSKINGMRFSRHPSIEAKMKFLSFGEMIANFIFLARRVIRVLISFLYKLDFCAAPPWKKVICCPRRSVATFADEV